MIHQLLRKKNRKYILLMTTNSRRNCRLREMHVGIVTSLRAGNKVLPSYPEKEQVVSDGSPCLLLKSK